MATAAGGDGVLDGPPLAGTHEIADITNVSNCTAFLHIESLVEEAKLIEARASYFKDKYQELHNRVLQIYSQDNFLLKRARQMRSELQAEKSRVENCAEVARGDDGTIQEKKKELAEAEHKLSVAQEKESMLQVEALELDRKKQNLTHEVEDAIAAEEARLKPQIENLHLDIRNIGNDIEKTAQEFDAQREKREKILAEEAQLKQDMETQANLIYEAKLEFTRIEREPDRASKQAEIVVKATATSHKELMLVEDKIAAQSTYLKDLEDKKGTLEAKNVEDWAKCQTIRRDIDSKMKTFDSFNSNLTVDKDQQASLQKKVHQLNDALQGTAIAMNQEKENFQQILRDKDNGMKEFKRIDQAKSDLNSEKEILAKQREVLRREQHRLEEARRQSEEDLADLKRDVDILINSFLKEEISEKRCVADKDSMMEVIKKLEDEVTNLTFREQAQKREASELAIHREQMSREASRNHGRVMIAKNEFKVKEVIVRELDKRTQELQWKYEQLVDQYTQIKRERSQKAAAIQSASQTMSETHEKIKILENELEVLRRESSIKDTELAKKSRDSDELRQTCKNLRVKKNKAKRRFEEASNEVRDLQQQMNKLNSVISHTEDQMLGLKKSYEEAVENRNYTGIQLIDRNDELCILYEKANIQEEILKRGMIMLNQRSEEIRKTAIELSDLQREIELCQRVLPEVRDLEEDLAQLMQDHTDERWRAEVLEKHLTDPANEARWRKLDTVKAKSASAGSPKQGSTTANSASLDAEAAMEGLGSPRAGSDLSEVTKKQEELEKRVATLNERLMEKELIYEEVTELSNKLRQQAMSGRDFTLALAKKVNDYQFGLKNKTKKMMSSLAELSMVQASSIQLGSQLSQSEEQLRLAKARVEEGLPPSETVVRRMEADERERSRRMETLRKSKDAKMQSESDAKMLRTTAEQRPNAYIPDSDLGLPTPYGAHQPFKPTLATQNNVSRFYRNTKQKELTFDDDDDDE